MNMEWIEWAVHVAEKDESKPEPGICFWIKGLNEDTFMKEVFACLFHNVYVCTGKMDT